MAEYTSNYSLEKQQGNEHINIEGLNRNFDTIDEELKKAQDRADEAFQSASNGKNLISGAITGKDPAITIPGNPTFHQLADAIGQIETGIDTTITTNPITPNKVLSGYKGFVNRAMVTGNIPSKGAATITPGTTNQVIAAGQYLTGAQTVLGDPDLIPANILSGKNIFGVTGNAQKAMYATGTAMSSASYIYIRHSTGGSSDLAYGLSVSGLGFLPRAIFAVRTSFIESPTKLSYRYNYTTYTYMDFKDTADVIDMMMFNNSSTMVGVYGTSPYSDTYVNNGSFCLAVASKSTEYTWFAWG